MWTRLLQVPKSKIHVVMKVMCPKGVLTYVVVVTTWQSVPAIKQDQAFSIDFNDTSMIREVLKPVQNAVARHDVIKQKDMCPFTLFWIAQPSW